MASIINTMKTIGLAVLKPNASYNILNTTLSITLQSKIQLQFVRTKVVRRIRGGGRPVPYGVIPPEPHKYKFRVVYPEDGKYTTRPLKIIKMGGRHPVTGQVVVETLGGGHKQKYRWVDNLHKRDDKKLEPFIEKIQLVRYCPVRTAHIALAASGETSRWVLAHQGMKAGDLITTYSQIPRIPVRPKEGDSHPVGALPVGTMIFNIAPAPGIPGIFCRAAATYGTLLRKTPDKNCIIQLPSKREISVNEKTMVTIGRASNLEKAGQHVGSPNRMRWLGHRPRTGLWHRKDGYCGRKIKPPKPVLEYPEVLTHKEEPFILNL